MTRHSTFLRNLAAPSRRECTSRPLASCSRHGDRVIPKALLLRRFLEEELLRRSSDQGMLRRRGLRETWFVMDGDILRPMWLVIVVAMVKSGVDLVHDVQIDIRVETGCRTRWLVMEVGCWGRHDCVQGSRCRKLVFAMELYPIWKGSRDRWLMIGLNPGLLLISATWRQHLHFRSLFYASSILRPKSLDV